MSHVEVAAEYEWQPELRELDESSIEGGQEAEFGLLARWARRSRWKIRADDGDVAETRLDVTPFAIKLRLTDSAHDLDGLGTRIDRNAAVSRLLGVRTSSVIATRMKRGVGDLFVARLELLHAEHVRALSSKPSEETLARCTAQAVRVEGDDSQEKSAGRKSEAI